jgi:hypothetical protein
MAGIFKSLDRSDVRITPFRTYKLWNDDLTGVLSGSVYTIYEADYNPIGSHLDQNPLRDVFDQGNPHYTQNEPTTSNGQYQRIVHASIDHLYYRDFLTNNKASFGSGNINTQVRYLEDKAYVISMPQSKFGEAILPNSVKIGWSGSWTNVSDPLYPAMGIELVIEDDGFGNLEIVSGYTSSYGVTLPIDGVSPVSTTPVGEWPFDNLYKYINIGPINVTSSLNPGLWSMEANYKDVSVSLASFPISQVPVGDSELLGAVLNFSSSLSSSITIKPNTVPEYAQRYNFENQDFTMSVMIIPKALPTHPSGSIIISKQGPVENLQVDENGNIFSQNIPNKSPYRLGLKPTGHLFFQMDAGTSQRFELVSGTPVDIGYLHHVIITKQYVDDSTTILTLVMSNYNNLTQDDGNIASIKQSDCSNQSNIYIGNSYKYDQGFDGIIDNVKIYNKFLKEDSQEILRQTLGVGNLRVGNVFYNNGMCTLTGIPMRYGNITTVEARGTHTIWENEITCTINPGEFGMSCNPTTQEYSSTQNQYIYKSFVTGSSFKPFVTTIGLYDDNNNMLAIGKLNMPIQLPDNMDTTFIIRYDK